MAVSSAFLSAGSGVKLQKYKPLSVSATLPSGLAPSRPRANSAADSSGPSSARCAASFSAPADIAAVSSALLRFLPLYKNTSVPAASAAGSAAIRPYVLPK